MDDPKTGKAQVDLCLYDQEISLSSLVCQDAAKDFLSKLVDQIHHDRFCRVRGIRLPTILLMSSSLLSCRLVARALANSLCDDFEDVAARHLGICGNHGTLLENNQTETVFHIRILSSQDAAYIGSSLSFLLSNNYLLEGDKRVYRQNKLLIFSAASMGCLDNTVLEHVDYTLNLKAYFNIQELCLILEKRLAHAGIAYRPKVTKVIAEQSQNSEETAIQILRYTLVHTRSDCRNTVTEPDVLAACRLYRKEKA